MGKLILTSGYAFAIFVLGYRVGLDANIDLVSGLSNIVTQCTGEQYGRIEIDGVSFICGVDKL